MDSIRSLWSHTRNIRDFRDGISRYRSHKILLFRVNLDRIAAGSNPTGIIRTWTGTGNIAWRGAERSGTTVRLLLVRFYQTGGAPHSTFLARLPPCNGMPRPRDYGSTSSWITSHPRPTWRMATGHLIPLLLLVLMHLAMYLLVSTYRSSLGKTFGWWSFNVRRRFVGRAARVCCPTVSSMRDAHIRFSSFRFALIRASSSLLDTSMRYDHQPSRDHQIDSHLVSRQNLVKSFP